MMSRYRISMALVALVLSLTACLHGNDSGISSPTDERATPSAGLRQSSLPPLDLDLFSRDELFAAGGGGCGMTLLPQAGELPQVTNPAGMLLFHGIDSPMWMKINQELVAFERIERQGEEFYGQTTEQTFRHGPLNLLVEIQVSLGEAGEIESVEIPNATVRMMRESGTGEIQEVEAIAVFGDAGC